MNERAPLELTEDRVPVAGIETAIGELVELYGGEVTAERERARDFALPLRRGNASAGAVECTLTWAPDAAVSDVATATVRLVANRDLDAPKAQRVLFLLAGVIGAVLFTLWPFFPHEREFGTLGALGGIVAIAVYLLTLRKTSGGIAADFLQRLAKHQRGDRR
ncbi:MAG: hypothetical protein JO197_06525 [Acidobacteria bacterium]|nr:hypothetical protein [Acidobacteriota bacterium]MBV9477509.1 hypothetical protein [Acidobacteriota bacterium]